jgi:hypothetical protein
MDPRWLDALKLPARIVAGLFLGSAVILILDYFAVVKLADIHALARPITIICVAAFGSLSLAALLGIIYDGIQLRRKPELLAQRRRIRRAEAMQHRAEFEERAIKRLDYLSKNEIAYAADCLRKNEQSFITWVHSPEVANLADAGLVRSPGGTHHQDYYPFYFADFAWAQLLKRKEEFIAKDNENKRQAAAAEKERRRLR